MLIESAAMKRLVLFCLFCLLALPTTAQESTPEATPESDAPYIYYYSGALNGVVVERADGTDSRIIGRGLVDEQATRVYGPGWSPDGTWFAWRVMTPGGFYRDFGRAYAISFDGQKSLDILNDFPCVHEMSWHPSRNILLVYGAMTIDTIDGCRQIPYPIATYWLIDTDSQSRLATFSINTSSDWRPVAYWRQEAEQLVIQEVIDSANGLQWLVVTMSFDGTVIMQPVPLETLDAQFAGLTLAMVWGEDRQRTEFTNWQANPEARLAEPPQDSSGAGYAVSGRWDITGKWILVGHESCTADCSYVTGRVSVYHPDTGLHREIADCGGHPTCIGWLPEQVDVASLSYGEPTSVLPTPISVDYERAIVRGLTFLPNAATHELVCELDSQTMNLVRNLETGAVDFVLPGYRRCEESLVVLSQRVFPQPEIVVFALSPNEEYYAITDSSEYTSLYDAVTGEHIATLNFYGGELSFSADSRYLITVGRFATATWDVGQLVANRLD